MSGLRIGILVDSALKQQHLGNLVVQAGHEIGCTCILNANSSLPHSLQIDAWVVDLTDINDPNSPDSEHSLIMVLLQDLLEQTDIPVILNEDIEFQKNSAEHNNWIRRMLQRLERLSGDINLHQTSSANEVWVLAASTGGPAAVKEFICYLSPDLNIAFVYVQHIDYGQAEALAKVMSKSGHYPCRVAKQGAVLINNTLTLITAGPSVMIHENGTLMLSKKSWSGSYAPSIDQVTANVARVYRKRCGMIVLSGLGDDGAASSKLIKQSGGQVWVQTPSDCISDSMPRATIAMGAVNHTGTPQELAIALSELKLSMRAT
ncbi:MAG: chemotaxis protein CheB [Pseudomonadota bacterium]